MLRFVGLSIAGVLAVTLATGCAATSEHRAAQAPPATQHLQFSVTGRAPSGVRVSYIATPTCPEVNCGGAPPVRVLSNHAHLPFHASVNIDPGIARYTLQTSGLGTGTRGSRIACTIQLGSVSVTRRVKGTGAASSDCNPSIDHASKPGHWVAERLFPIPVPEPSFDTGGFSSALRTQLRGNHVVLLPAARVVFMTTGSFRCGLWPDSLTVLGHSKIRIDMRVNGRSPACAAGSVRHPVAVWINPTFLNLHRPLTAEFTYTVRHRQWRRTVVIPGLTQRSRP